MSNIYGKNIKISIFGQSHSPAAGVTIEGIPAGFKIDFEELSSFLKRRAPNRGKHTTARSEPDEPEFISGFAEGVTCGAPVTAVIKNTDARPNDYEQIFDIPRPSHADYAAYKKYGEKRDFRGGGQFSGRLTVPLCVAGGIFLQLLKRENINIGAHIKQIGKIRDKSFDPVNINEKELNALKKADFPVIDFQAGEQMLEFIEKVKNSGDSAGGIVECAVIGVPAGIGEPMFDGLENKIAAVLFGIPALKGVEFGNGFSAAELRGSENNDAFIIKDGEIKTQTNNHGGILSGISSGMPIIFCAAFKPTPSISKRQKSVSLSQMENTILEIKGRHDPCIAPRAVPCVEAAAAIAIFDALSEVKKYI